MSNKNWKLITMPWSKNNPVTVQVLGICSCLAVTAQLKPAVVMAVSVTVVVALSKQLSVFVGLIITNCIVMGRLEAFAMSNPPLPSLCDGIGNGLGYSIILIILGFLRELFGSGTLWGYPVMESLGFYNFGYENNGLMIMPPMALILVGIIIWIQRTRNKDLCE